MWKKFKYLTLNVGGLTNAGKRLRVQKLLQREKLVCVCLQETHLKAGEEKWLKQLFQGSIFHAHSQNRARGVMIGLAENAPWDVKEVLRDEKGRYVILKGLWARKELILAGIYAPHGQQAQYWEEVFGKVLQMWGTQMIILGTSMQQLII